MAPEQGGPTRPTSLATRVANYKTSSPHRQPLVITSSSQNPLPCTTTTDAGMKGVPAAADTAGAPVPATKISMPASAAGGAEAALLGKGRRYKVWALAAIALLALWSMSAASVSLRWSSSGDLASVYGDLDAPLGDDLDSLVLSSPHFYIFFITR